MYIVLFVRRFRSVCTVTFGVAAFAVLMAVPSAIAQEPTHQHESATQAQAQHAGHDMSEMARDASGTAWLPYETPMYAIHSMRGPWTLMFHENAFLQYLHESGNRGDDQVGSINWVMGMAERNPGSGRLRFRGMVSLEPLSIPGCGYPDLLATGEACNGEKIHDRQHPHDLFVELAADYTAPLAGNVRGQVYGGPVGEPALGPVAYPHRVSALPNPLAPIGHHWFDSTHIAFGVITGGIYGPTWKAETSVFNGREPDEDRTDFELAALDSFSGRLWFLPTRRLALQVSAGHLNEAEPGEAGGPRADVNRVTASATYHRPFGRNSIWATTLAWGRNEEQDHTSNAALIETNVTLNERDTWYGRFEGAGKSAHDLDAAEPPSDFAVSKLQGGYSRYLPAWHGFQPGAGAGISVGIVPETLRRVYGSRTNVGFAVYLTLRPAAITHPAATAAAPVDHSQHAAQPSSESPAAPHTQHETPP
jgi:hypothetical protein